MKKILSKYWPIKVIILIFILVFFYLFKSKMDFFGDTVVNQVIPMEGVKLENIHYVQDNQDEGSRWVLDAEEARFSKDGQKISFQNFIFKLESENSVSLELKGNEGDYNKESSEVNLRGNLEGITDNGYSIITEHILYRQNEGSLQSNEVVQIIGPFFSVTGQGLIAHVEKKALKILKNTVTMIDKGSFNI